MSKTTFLAIVLAFSWTAYGQDLVRIPASRHIVKDQITSVNLEVSVPEFTLAATEVTQKDYEAITGTNPSFYRGAERPVENVSWWDAIRYCNLRSAREGLPPCYDLATGTRNEECTGYRLPTEAEWMAAAGPAPAPGELEKFAVLGASSTKSVSIFDSALKNGTAAARSRQPGASGLYDLRGNVWEWCGDYFDALTSPDSVRDPRGPANGLERVIRGGSFVSTTSRWSRDYRSSMRPETRSRFTGFRVARSVAAPAGVPASPRKAQPAPEFVRRFQSAPEGFANATGSLAEVLPAGATAESWPGVAASLREKWLTMLAEPKLGAGKPASRLLREVAQRNFTGQIIELEVEPESWQKIYVLRPAKRGSSPLPVLIVPFYDIDTPAASDLGGRNYAPDRGVNAFAYTAAQNGYIAVAVRWFGESYGESYSEAVAHLAARHPGATGLGKWLADARRIVDFIGTLPDADQNRIGIMGHSLGGKMALYAAAFEPRIRAVVSSELGIGFPFSNYEDYWYLGDRLASLKPGSDQHELLALVAPRPFLLIGGDEFDKSESWYYINAARKVYGLLGQPASIGYFNHHKGHTPTPDAVSAAFEWLNHFLTP